MHFPTWRDWAFSLKVFTAAMLALFLAQWLQLPRPYWAVSSVYITCQPLAGATRSKSLYRVFGTFLGAVAAVILVPNLVNAPELLSLAMATWIGLCIYLSLLDRTPKSYVFLLAGYTAAFIGFPAVDEPGTIFDVAVTRVEEILVGILCASFVMSIVLPGSVAPDVKDRIDHWFADARAWSSALLGRFGGGEDSQARRWRLASGAVALDALITPLRHDMSGAERSADAVATLRQHMLMFLPVAVAIADRITALQQIGPLPDKVRRCLDEMAAWIASGTTEPRAADRMRDAVAAIDPSLDDRPPWATLLVATLAARLWDYIDLRQDARLLQRHIADGAPVHETLAFRYTAEARRIRYRDHTMAFLSAIGAFLSLILACGIWIGTAWIDGASAPLIAAVGCSLFATQDDPAPQIMGFANAALIGAVGATIYLFAVLPVATTFEMLVLALAPGLIVSGLLMTQPRVAVYGLGTSVIGFTLLSLQNNYSGEFAPFANSTIAAIIGLWISAIVTRLVRSVGSAWTARRLWRTNRKSLSEAADHQGTGHGLELAALMLDRVGLIAPRLTSLTKDDAEWTSELMTEVRIGIDLVQLRRVRHDLSPETAHQLDAFLVALSRHFKSIAVHAPFELLAPLDACLNIVAAKETEPARHDALLGLTDLRRSLFPDAPPYQSGGSAVLAPELAA